MPRKKKQKREPNESRPILESGPLAHRPFQVLTDLKRKEEAPPAPIIDAPPKPLPPEDDTELFRAAMSDVREMHKDANRVTPIPGPTSPGRPAIYMEDVEVLAQLEDLVAGRAAFDIVDTDEYLEGYIRGIHPVTIEKLRRGHFSVQAHLDLHGLTVREAEEAVREFINEAISLGYRCVLLVHGRGLNSKDHIPVLKKKLETILLRGPVRKQILAFTSARPHDGGAGASYVLLRAKH